MTYDDFNHFCQALPATTHVVQWGHADVWKVGGKVFAIGGWEKTAEPAFTFKTCELDFELLKDQPGYRPAPYLASRGMTWIQRFSDTGDDDELRYYLKESHHLVSLGLSRKKRRELGLEAD